ncbi:MAG: hypothetical protein JWN98_2412 [Abditibacteriota bacterium]|nr:hypothetical protein [Abditibacteriota bacterium]
MHDSSLLPVVLVAGFLGAGKTTLMRRLILSAHKRDLRAAVIVNEFGQNDVDSHILREADAELIASIAGGCACCTGQDDLLQTLQEIATRLGPRPDVVLIESSGLADPVLLLDVLTAAPLLPLVRVAAILCVVDAAHPDEIAGSLGPLLRRQIGMADWIVLNKTDLLAAPQLAALQEALGTLNPHANIARAVQCDFDLSPLWQAVATSDGVQSTSARGASAQSTLDSAAAAAHAQAHTIVCPLPHPVERTALEAAFAALQGTVWRAKGFARVRGESGLRLIQYTGGPDGAGRLHIAPFSLPHGSAEPDTFLVFIGAALDGDALKRDFGMLTGFW